jgi:mannan endo-1,6-alpha-mannosidase
MTETACELLVPPTCDTDMLSFKAYLSRWMAAASKVAPFISDQVLKTLTTSAAAAALQCCGGKDGRSCGLQWLKGAVWDGSTGVGQQMAALEVIISTQIGHVAPPVTNTTGGTSVGNPNAGSGSVSTAEGLTDSSPITAGDRVGAGIVTTAVLIGLIGGLAWLVLEIQ